MSRLLAIASPITLQRRLPRTQTQPSLLHHPALPSPTYTTAEDSWAQNEGATRHSQGWWILRDGRLFISAALALRIVSEHHSTSHLGKTGLKRLFVSQKLLYSQAHSPMPLYHRALHYLCQTQFQDRTNPTTWGPMNGICPF